MLFYVGGEVLHQFFRILTRHKPHAYFGLGFTRNDGLHPGCGVAAGDTMDFEGRLGPYVGGDFLVVFKTQ